MHKINIYIYIFLCQLHDFFFHLSVLSSEINREKILTKWAFQKKKSCIPTVPNSVNSITVNFRYNMNFGLSSFQHFLERENGSGPSSSYKVGVTVFSFSQLLNCSLQTNDICFKNAPCRVWFSGFIRINIGRFMGWGGLRGQQRPLFSEVFLKNSQYNKKYLYSWQVSRSPLSEFS